MNSVEEDIRGLNPYEMLSIQIVSAEFELGAEMVICLGYGEYD